MKRIVTAMVLLLPGGWIPLAFAALGTATADFNFDLTFGPSVGVQISTPGLSISGVLNGAGSHEERWGSYAHGNTGVPGSPDIVGDNPQLLHPERGKNWQTQAIVTGDSFQLYLSNAASAAYPPVSFSYSKSTATPGVVAEVYNPTSEDRFFSFTLNWALTVDVVASAGPGERAWAEADWAIVFGQTVQGVATPFLSLVDEMAMEASLGGPPRNAVHLAGGFHSGTGEGTLVSLLHPRERIVFTLDRAELTTSAAAVPEPGSVAWVIGASVVLCLAVHRRLRGRMHG